MKSLETRRIEMSKVSSNSEAPVERGSVAPVTSRPKPDDVAPYRRDPRSNPDDRIDGRLPDNYLLQGRYRILGVHGVGGMSIVYKARDLRFVSVTRLCVVKEMRNAAADPELRMTAIRNFEREANILAALNHPGIVQVYDFFTEGESGFLVMEFVDGSDLEASLASGDGHLPEEQVISWAIQVCDVLIYLHSHRPHPIIFRDMKPSNILVDRSGRVRLIDFGIARVFQDDQKGTMVGTEGYSPPEQYRGVVDQRSDVYALGATLHHLLTRRDPRMEPPFSFHERSIREENPGVSEELANIVSKALEYDVDKRFASAEQLKSALMRLGDAQGTRATLADDVVSTGIAPLELWRFACEDEIRSAPRVHNGVIYVSAYDNNLYALSCEDGEFLWKYPTDGSIGASPALHAGQVLVASSDRILYSLSTNTGRIRWTCPTQGSLWASPCVALDHVFFGSDDGKLYAANVQSGRVAWSFQADGMVRSSPAAMDDLIFFGCEGAVLYAIDITGKARWHFRARRAITSSPCVADGFVYVGCSDSFVYCLDAHSGWSVWRYRTNGAVISSPAVSDGVLYVGSSDRNLYALKADTGVSLWHYTTGGQVASSPCVANGAVYVGSTDGTLYCLDARTGTFLWRVQTGGALISSPTVVQDVVYIGSNDHYVYAFPA